MTTKPSVFSFAIKFSGIVWLSFLLAACAAPISVATPKDLHQAYQRAVADAAVAAPDEIYRNLEAVTADNALLQWEGIPGKSRVRVTTWTGWAGYDDKVGQQLELAVDPWVTLAPQLQSFCRAATMKRDDLVLRLEQLLGLPPNSGKDRFVEFWVDTRDLFRPSPDPAISDHEAELDFPVSTRFVQVSEAHVQWFEAQKRKSYGTNGYPWTRLGYTYDWGNPDSEVGLSEFVIRKGAVVAVTAVYTIEEFCR